MKMIPGGLKFRVWAPFIKVDQSARTVSIAPCLSEKDKAELLQAGYVAQIGMLNMTKQEQVKLWKDAGYNVSYTGFGWRYEEGVWWREYPDNKGRMFRYCAYCDRPLDLALTPAQIAAHVRDVCHNGRWVDTE